MATVTNITPPSEGESVDFIDLLDTLRAATCLTELIYFAAQGAGGTGQAGITAGCDVLVDVIEKAQQKAEALHAAGAAQ